MNRIKMQCLTIRIRKNDTIDGKRIYAVILDLVKNQISQVLLFGPELEDMASVEYLISKLRELQ